MGTQLNEGKSIAYQAQPCASPFLPQQVVGTGILKIGLFGGVKLVGEV